MHCRGGVEIKVVSPEVLHAILTHTFQLVGSSTVHYCNSKRIGKLQSGIKAQETGQQTDSSFKVVPRCAYWAI